MEIGGDFDWVAHPQDSTLPWPEPAVRLARGRDAVTLGLRLSSKTTEKTRLFVPAFFCDEVIEAWRSSGIHIERYRDQPNEPAPNFNQLDPTATDAVLVVNYFGFDAKREFSAEVRSRFNCLIIEDHTHDPLSAWAQQSKADFAFASLRKTLPVSDGCLLWSPVGHTPFDELPALATYGYGNLVAAMALKSRYLNSEDRSAELKAAFRALLAKGHENLEASMHPMHMSVWSQVQLEAGYPTAWRQQRQDNMKMLVDNLVCTNGAKLIYTTWSDDQCPFVCALSLRDESQRNALRQALIENDIFPPVHWLSVNTPDKKAIELGQVILSLPIDHRYATRDMLRMAAVVNNQLKR